MRVFNVQNVWKFSGRGADNSFLHVRSKQQYTWSVGCNNVFEIGESRFKLPRRRSVIQKFIVTLTGIIRSYITTISFQTLPIYYKLQNAQWSEELQFQQRIRLNLLMCELYVRVKLYKAACSMSDADSHFFTNHRDSCSCSLLIVCTFAQEHIGANVRLTKEI